MFFSKSSLKDYIGILYYRHGLFCASNPFSCLFVVITVVVICCYPLKNLSSFSNYLEQYKQPVSAFDGLEANAFINEFVQYERLADRPAWYNRVPVAYIQRIVIKSIIKIPSHNKNDDEELKLYLIDAFRAPIAQLFDLNEFIRNFRTENHSSPQQQSLVGDLCVHVGELKRKQSNNNKMSREDIDINDNDVKFNAHFFPEFNCLYLSPANFWFNDFNLFQQDNDIIKTIYNIVHHDQQPQNQEEDNLFGTTTSSTTKASKDGPHKSWSSFLKSLFSQILNYSTNNLQSKNQLRELLFGVSWESTLTSLSDHSKLLKKISSIENGIKSKEKNTTKIFNQSTHQREQSKSIVLTYAITIALKKYDKSFLKELKARLQQKFDLENRKAFELKLDKFHMIKEQNKENDEADEEEVIVNLLYTSQSYVYYIPFIVLYFLLFLYIYITVRKIEFVKSKWGLAFAAVSQVVASLLMSIGICSFFGLTPTLNGGEIFPYLIIFIGFENIVVLTKSVVSTPFDLDVRYRIALGLKKESWLITKIITFELIIIFFGILTMVPTIQEFCVFAYVGLLIDFFMQMIFFVTVLSIDIRRMELTDLHKKTHTITNVDNDGEKKASNEDNLSSIDTDSQILKEKYDLNALADKNNSNNLVFRGGLGILNSRWSSKSKAIRKQDAKSVDSSNDKTLKNPNYYSNFFTNKSVQLFYFWASTRIFQRAVIVLSILWIVLIFYKSLLVVELMRHDIDVKKETVDALIPKNNLNLPRLIKDNFEQLLSITTASTSPFTVTAPTASTTASNKLKRHPQHDNMESWFDLGRTKQENVPNIKFKSPEAYSDQSWQTLNHNHWLALFDNYNVSLYNRYVAILPQIDLFKLIRPVDILKYRNRLELEKYSSIISLNDLSLNLVAQLYENSLNASVLTAGSGTEDVRNFHINNNEGLKTQLTYKSALFELIGIVVFGLPIIFLTIYFLFLFYKCICSKNYEQWRKKWSTSNIKRQYKIIHLKNDDNVNDKVSDYETDDEREILNDRPYVKREINKDDLIHKIMNGQEDEMELEPLMMLNKNVDDLDKPYHNYPVDLISCGCNVVAISDISNQISVWSLPSNTMKCNRVQKVNMTSSLTKQNESVWSMCLSNDDNYLFVGQSNGLLRVVELNDGGINGTRDNFSPTSSIYLNDKTSHLTAIGITHIVQLTKTFNHQKSLQLKNVENSPSSLIMMLSPQIAATTTPTSSQFTKQIEMQQQFDYLLVLARLNGHIELVKLTCLKNEKQISHHSQKIRTPSFTTLSCIKVHEGPITNLYYPNFGEYLLSTSQDSLVKVITISWKSDTANLQLQHQRPISVVSTPICINTSSDKLTNYAHQQEQSKCVDQEELIVKFVLNDHENSTITAMCIDNENILSCATGSSDGLICLWNLFTGECKLKLNAKNPRRAITKYASNERFKESSILKLELVENILISLNADPQMCFWNKTNGQLIKEFRFFAPISSLSNYLNTANNDETIMSISSSIYNFAAYRFLKSIINYFSVSSSSISNINTHLNTRVGTQSAELFQPPPTMCLFSKTILITGGLSCIFLWNINKGELIKKINIKKSGLLVCSSNKSKALKNYQNQKKCGLTNSVYAQVNHIRDIRLIEPNCAEQLSQLNMTTATSSLTPAFKPSSLITRTKKQSKLLLISDYTDAIYILKIPTNI